MRANPYGLTEEQTAIQDMCREIVEKEIIPKRAELDANMEFPHDIIKVIAEQGLFQLFIPEEYGGAATGPGIFDMCLATEELSKGCGAVSVTYAASALGIQPIILFGSEEQKKKWLPLQAEGRMISAFALSEPDAGSDAGNMKTTAVRDGNDWILNGSKKWITNGCEAEICVIIASTDKSKGSRGMTAFLVERDTPGFTVGRKEDKMGIRASCTSELFFEDCRIPHANIIGKEGRGFVVAMTTLDRTRPGIGAQAVGIAQGAFDEAIKYAQQRVQFGRPISSLQGIQFMLADMATQIEAARALTYQVCRMIEAGSPGFSKYSAMCKLIASDMAMKVTTDAVQILGGYGYVSDYPLEKMMRDAKVTQIYEGTNQIQRVVIAANLLKEYSVKA